MITVHGSFIPHATAGFFFIWGLDSDREPGPAPRRALRLHPQAVARERLFRLLRGVPHVNDVICVVRMPDRKGLVPFRVPGIALATASAAQWLLDLDTACAGAKVQAGASLRAWSAASKLLMELLGRGRLLPSLRVEAGCLTADWRLAAPEPADAARLTAIEAALPDLCRAVVPPDRKHKSYQPPGAGALLGQFLHAATQGLVRGFLAGVAKPHPQPRRRTAAQHWLLSLVGAAPADLPPDLPDAGELYAAFEDWSAPASASRGPGSLRTGIRLNPPADTADGDWEVELVLQTPSDPPLSIAAAAVWQAIGVGIELGGQRYLNAEQRILADLPALVRLCPPLAPLVGAAAPSRVSVAAADVEPLLREAVPRLQEAGFPVLLPAGLVRGGTLRARVRLRAGGAAPTEFGLDHLVDVDWELALGGLPLTVGELERLARQKLPLVQLRGRWVQVDPRGLAAALRNLAPHRQSVSVGTALRLSAQAAAPAGLAGNLADHGAAATPGLAGGGAGTETPLWIEDVTAEGWLADLLQRLNAPGRIEPVPVPAGFRGTLRPYQERGLAWLAFLRRWGLGACLADDMGLGKTIQVIALLLHEREGEAAAAAGNAAAGSTADAAAAPTLIVCPVSLVGNWRRELARFAPGLRVLVHHGAGRAGGEDLVAAARGHDVVITTYTLLARDGETLASVPWAGLIADEAQNIKNAATQHARVLRGLPGGYRIALTGTPVENHLGDLWSIFAFLNPGLLGGYEDFRRTYQLPIERYREPQATARLRRLVQPFVLRRLKTDPAIIADLPEKVEATVYVNLTLEQAALYEAVVQETLERAAGAAGIQRHGAVLAGLTRLKQVCNHPAHAAPDGGLLAGRSGKLDRLTEMLEEVLSQGDSALIFTQFAAFGAQLQRYLSRRFDCPVLFLDGSTSRPERDRLIERFQAGAAPLFVLSLKAGGVGLNLTAASHVFHFDRWWNPAVEDQATDRAYRIGQERRVLVHRLVTAGTLEERIDRLLSEKRALSDQVIGTGEAWLGHLSTAELRELIRLEGE